MVKKSFLKLMDRTVYILCRSPKYYVLRCQIRVREYLEKSLPPLSLRHDSGSWLPLTGLRDHTHRTHHTR